MTADSLTPKQMAPFIILVLSLMLIQVVGAYIGSSFLALEGLKGYWLIGRLLLPLVIITMLAIPLRSLFLALPRFNQQQIDKPSLIIIVIAVLGLIGLSIYLQFFAADYLNHYRRGASLEMLREAERFQRFLIFTLSTLIGWEILHRGFLLGGGLYCLTAHYRIQPQAAMVIIIMIVCLFEVLFHIKKPIYEALGMVIASPLLSYLTIKCRSLWPALTIHLMIELIFGFSAYYYSVN